MSPGYGSPQLDLAAKWALALELNVEPLAATDAEGHPVPGLVLSGPLLKYVVVEAKEVLLLLCDLTVPDQVRSGTAKLQKKLQEEMLIALRQALSDSPRLGWSLIPPTTTKISDLAQVRLSERLRLDESQVASFNRFADAIQEISTAAVRSGEVFGPLMMGSTLTSRRPSDLESARTGFA